jgi:hypothetical protein
VLGRRSVAAELIAPRILTRATGDTWDAVAYAGGALMAGLFWRHRAGGASTVSTPVDDPAVVACARPKLPHIAEEHPTARADKMPYRPSEVAR